MRGALIGALLTTALAAEAAAQEEAPHVGAPPPAAEPPGDDGGKGDGKGTPDRLQFGGRVFVRDSLASGINASGDTVWREDRTIDSGRAFLDFRPNKRLRMVLEVEFAGNPELKDTFVRYRPVDALAIKAGRFKRPVSFIGLESAWSLPRIDRGLLNELRVGGRRLPFAGNRSDGLALEAEFDGSWKPELTVAIMESEISGEVDLDVTENSREDVYARVELEPVEGLHVAAAGGWVGTLHREGEVDSHHHRPFGTFEAMFESGPLRVWAEAMAGLNHLTYQGDVQIGRFYAGRTLVAPRLSRLGPLRTLEPFAAFSWFEPSTLQDGDQLTEVTGGVAIAISRNLRLQAEGGRRFEEEGGGAIVGSATLVRLQLGAAFEGETLLE